MRIYTIEIRKDWEYDLYRVNWKSLWQYSVEVKSKVYCWTFTCFSYHSTLLIWRSSALTANIKISKRDIVLRDGKIKMVNSKVLEKARQEFNLIIKNNEDGNNDNSSNYHNA